MDSRNGYPLSRLPKDPPAYAPFCTVAQNGGSPGSLSSNCTFTYDVTPIGQQGTVNYSGAITPIGPPRAPNVTYTAATLGIFYIDPTTGDIQLYLLDETPNYAAC